MPFCKYQHVERLGTQEVDGILDGTVYVFPKIDDANKSVWLDNGEVCCATRNKPEITGKFVEYVQAHKGIRDFLLSHPACRLYGEWLIPHTLKTYMPDAWNTFYVFDVMAYPDADSLCYVPYDDYKGWMDTYGIEYIPCIATVENGTAEIFDRLLEQNTYLIKADSGIGEGIVIKRYDFVNKYGRTTWAKRIASTFKYDHYKAMGVPALKGGTVIEEVIVNEYVTSDIVAKEVAKIRLDRTGVSATDDAAYVEWDTKWIPQLLGCVYHTLIVEELWHALKKYKAHQIIDFRVLNKFTTKKIKELKPEVF